jgi:hypothetical protein
MHAHRLDRGVEIGEFAGAGGATAGTQGQGKGKGKDRGARLANQHGASPTVRRGRNGSNINGGARAGERAVALWLPGPVAEPISFKVVPLSLETRKLRILAIPEDGPKQCRFTLTGHFAYDFARTNSQSGHSWPSSISPSPSAPMTARAR